MKHGSLFSGIGGFDLAAEWMGWDNVFHCEIDEFPRKILQYYWPNSISYENIKTADFTIHRGQIDILTGGFPCQPYSMAGKRRGKEDDRHLWPDMLRAIREIQPRWVVGENVRGLVNWSGGLVFEEVQTDLEAEGYKVQPFILPAASVNAPHRRDRIWFVAYSDKCNDGGISREDERTCGEERISERNKVWEPVKSSEIQRDAADTTSKGSRKLTQENRRGQNRRLDDDGKTRVVTNTSNKRLQGCEDDRGIAKIREERKKQFTGCLSPTWQNFPTQSPICGGDDGISAELDGITFSKWRNGSIKGYGNAIVPQVVYQIFLSIKEYEESFFS